jgi:hypothetical protein
VGIGYHPPRENAVTASCIRRDIGDTFGNLVPDQFLELVNAVVYDGNLDSLVYAIAIGLGSDLPQPLDEGADIRVVLFRQCQVG